MRTLGLLACLASGLHGVGPQEPPVPAPVPATAWRSPVELFLGPALRTRIGAALVEPAAAVPASDAVITADPAATAVATPSAETVTLLVSLDCQVIGQIAPPGAAWVSMYWMRPSWYDEFIVAPTLIEEAWNVA